jgi:hypothetical protein
MSRRTFAAITDRQSSLGRCVQLSHLIVLFALLILPARAQIDTNSNGLSDVWERLFNNGELFDPQNPDHAPGADPDGDGWSNLKESIAGTDPFFGNPPEGMVATQITYLKDQEEAPTPEFPEGRLIDLTVISWETLPGKQYTLLFSPDLTASSWLGASAPIIGDGQPAAVAVTLTDVEGEEPDKLFWRVAIDDLDSDGDGLTDYEEFILGTSPFHQDSDGDEIPDYWEVVYDLDPLDLTDADQPFQGGPSTNIQAYQVGVQAHPNASLEDFDGDGVPNEADAAPWDSLIDWELSGVDRFVVIEMQAQILNSAGQTDPRVIGLDSEGNVLLASRNVSTNLQGGGFWKVAANTFDPAAEVSVSYNDPVWGYITRSSLGLRGLAGDGLVYYANAPVDYNFGGALVAVPGEAAYGFWPAFRAIEGEAYDVWPLGGDIRGTTYCYVDRDGANGAHGFPSSLYLLERPVGGQPTVTQAATFSDFENASQHSLLAVTRQGWVAFFDKILHPLDAVTLVSPGTSIEGGWLQDLPERSKASASVALRAAPPATGILVPDDNSAWQSPKTFEGQPIIAAMPSGTFVNSQHELWTRDRREKHTDSAEVNWLPPRDWAGDTFADLIEDGWIPRYVPGASDTSGSFAIHLEKLGETSKVLLFVPFELIPSRQLAEVSADDSQISVVVRMDDGTAPSNGPPPYEDSIVEWQIESGSGGTLSQTTTTVKDGLTAVTLNTSTNAGDTYVVKARLKSLRGQGDLGDAASWVHSPEITVVPGQPHTITLTKSKDEYRSDGTDTIEVEAEIKDEAGNLVADGTAVTWGVDQSPTPPFESIEVETTDGKATAVVVAPLIPEDQIVSATAGAASEDTTITVERVTGSISGNINLDVGGQNPNTSTITATVDAIDGTPVFWFTSNGEITEESTVSGGSATATLSTQGGCLGTVVVTATVGDRLLIHEGAFVSDNGFAIGADYPVIVGDATSNGSEIVNYDHGLAREIPHFASTPVRLRGPANQLVNVSVQGSLPVAEWIFSSATNGVVESVTGNHPLTLVGSGATIFQNAGITGQGTLVLDGNSHATVEADTELDFTSEFTATLRVLAGSHQASTLISKPGSWKIEMLSDGKVRAVVETDQGTYSANSSSALAINTWSEIELDFRFNGLTLSVNQVLVAETATSGTLNVNSQAFSIGNGFEGFIDALSLRSDAALGSHIGITGLGAGGVIHLDANGDGSFTVSSLGSAPHGMDIHIEASYNPRTRTKIRSVGKWLWNAVSDCAISFVGGDPQTTAGTVASIAGGILVVGDVGSICKNLYRMTGFSDTEPKYVELSLGGLGVATTALAVTGVGAAIPVAIAPLKTLAIRFGTQGVQMLTVFIDMIRKSMASGVISFQMRHLSLVETMVTDIPVSQAYRAFAHTPEVVNAAAKAADDVIGVGAGFHQAIVRTVSTHGNDIAKALTETVDGLGDAALASLRALPANQLDEALDGLARVLTKGVNPEAMRRVLNNPQLFANTQYTRVNLLKDLDEIAFANVKV